MKGTAQSSRHVQPTVGSAKILSVEEKNSRQFSLKKRPSLSPSRRQLRARGKVDGQRSRLSRDQTAAWGTGCAAVHGEGRHAWKKAEMTRSNIRKPDIQAILYEVLQIGLLPVFLCRSLPHLSRNVAPGNPNHNTVSCKGRFGDFGPTRPWRAIRPQLTCKSGERHACFRSAHPT